MSREAAERAVRDGDVDLALETLQKEVRQNPADAKARVFLFQLLCVMGQWERAHAQLKVAAELDAAALPMAQMYREALLCEVLRHDVFAGRKSPVIFGEPDEWLALLVESLSAVGGPEQARRLRDRAFELAPATSGSIDGTPFEWIADADMRLGPVCEAVVSGRYYWVPFSRIARIDIEPPEDLRDLVWMPAHFQFANGGESVGLIPTRYPGSQDDGDGAIRLARKTTWTEASPDVFVGLGQRWFTTDAGEHPLMEVRAIAFGDQAAATPTGSDA